ncbi:hypothetical protein ABPG72_003095 [Tetrahymena utriculariae]
MSEASIGIMEGAFFVPKSEILNWINTLLQLNLTKIEQLGTGSVYCQIIDVLYPGTVKMNRINWKARNEWEFIVNLKYLQQAFQKNNIKKYIEIEKLSKAKYQDNLEFAQWMKRYFDINNGQNNVKDYDPVAKRGVQNSETDFSFLDMRDNSRMAAMRGGGAKNDNSADQKYLRKKMVTRSKSPILKSLEKNQYILGTKSKELKLENMQKKQLIDERDILIIKFQEIQAVLGKSNLGEAQKIQEITKISNYVMSLNLEKSKEQIENDENNFSSVRKRNSIDKFQHNNTIKEEDSPPRSERQNTDAQFSQKEKVIKNNSQISNSSNLNNNPSGLINNNYTVANNTNKKSVINNQPLTGNNNQNIPNNSGSNQNSNSNIEDVKQEKASHPNNRGSVQKTQIEKDLHKKQTLARVNKHSEQLKQKAN